MGFVEVLKVVGTVVGGGIGVVGMVVVVGIVGVVEVVTGVGVEVSEESDEMEVTFDGSDVTEESLDVGALSTIFMSTRLAFVRATRTSRRNSNREICVMESIVAIAVAEPRI